MPKILEYATVGCLGAVGYMVIEILWRGYSHWTMALTGGVCFFIIYMNEELFFYAPLWKRCLVGSLAVTLIELVEGFFVNILLGWAVWDYSAVPFNVCGQICLLYSGLWFLLCMPLVFVCRHLRKMMQYLHRRFTEQTIS